MSRVLWEGLLWGQYVCEVLKESDSGRLRVRYYHPEAGRLTRWVDSKEVQSQ